MRLKVQDVFKIVFITEELTDVSTLKFNVSQKTKTIIVPHRTLSLPASVLETCNLVLTFESVDEILWCDHSNETSSAVFLHGTICFSIFYKMKFGNVF